MNKKKESSRKSIELMGTFFQLFFYLSVKLPKLFYAIAFKGSSLWQRTIHSNYPYPLVNI